MSDLLLTGLSLTGLSLTGLSSTGFPSTGFPSTGLPSTALLLTAVAALWGAAVGVLVPRAAYRFSVEPEEEWRDACPAGHPLEGLARGWLGRARCGVCDRGRAYGPSTPLVVLATTLVCAALAWATGARPELGVWLLLAPVGVLLALIDFRVRRLPDMLTLPLAGTALVLLGVAALVPGHAGHWPTALWGALALSGWCLVSFLISPDIMGFGDVKAAVGLGAALGWYGWDVLLLGTFAWFFLGGVYAGWLVVVRRVGRRASMPYGPFLIAGAFVGVLLGALAA